MLKIVGHLGGGEVPCPRGKMVSVRCGRPWGDSVGATAGGLSEDRAALEVPDFLALRFALASLSLACAASAAA